MKFSGKINNRWFVFVSLFFALASAIILIIVKKQPWEYLTAFFTGAFFGNLPKEAKKWIVVISSLTFIGAIIFDPSIKPLLDKLLGVKTVGSLGGSLLINSFLFLLFWIGYSLSEKIKEKLAVA